MYSFFGISRVDETVVVVIVLVLVVVVDQVEVVVVPSLKKSSRYRLIDFSDLSKCPPHTFKHNHDNHLHGRAHVQSNWWDPSVVADDSIDVVYDCVGQEV